MPHRPAAIVSAMHEELRALLPLLHDRHTVRLAGRDFHHGLIHDQPVVLALSGIGKVAAATTAVLLMHAYDARQLVFTGVAGGLAPGVNVGDVVVARQLLQHDMDASPLFPRFEVPLYGTDRFAADEALSTAMAAAAQAALAPDAPHTDDGLGPALAALAAARASAGLPPHQPRLHQGLVLSGDCFVSSRSQCDQLLSWHPEALAVEMEGAALAQVCADFGLPFAVLRTISDRADDQAHVDFPRFIAETASRYTLAIVSRLLGSAL